MLRLEVVDCSLPGVFHACEAYDVEPLESVGAVRRITKEDNVVLSSIVEDLVSVVGTMTVNKNDTSTPICLLAGMAVETLLNPITS